MLTPQPFTEEHHEGRDGEEQQPRERTTPAAVIPPQDYSYPHEEDHHPQQQHQQQQHQQQEEEEEEENDWFRNGGRQRLDSRPAERRRTSTPQEVSPPLRLRVSKSPVGGSSARGKIHAATNENQENGPGRKSLSSRRSSPRVSTMTHPQNEKKRGVYARLVRDAARKFAPRSPSRHTASVGGKSPSRGLESGRYGHRSAATADSVITITATVPPSTSGGTSVSPERSHVGMGLTVGFNHEEGGEVMTTHMAMVVRQEGLFTSHARRIVQQAEPIERSRDQHNTGSALASGGNVGGLSKKQSLCRPKRLLAPNDILWKRERRHRRSLAGEQGYPTANMPQLVMEVPELPAVLEVALADHFLAALMTCGAAEVERVVSLIAPNDTQQVLQQLRQMYGEARHSGYTSSTLTRRASRGKVDQRAEWLATHRRHLTSTMRSIAQCNGGKPDGVNGVNATHFTTRRMRNFLRIFIREVCMTFMDECCALCALRRDRVRAEQPREVRARGVTVPDEVLDPFYTQVLSRLLFCILGWTDKESARVMSALVLQVKRQLPPYGRVQLPAQA